MYIVMSYMCPLLFTQPEFVSDLVVVRPPNVVKLGKCSLVWSITIVAVENIDMFICGPDAMMVLNWNQVNYVLCPHTRCFGSYFDVISVLVLVCRKVVVKKLYICGPEGGGGVYSWTGTSQLANSYIPSNLADKICHMSYVASCEPKS